MLDTTEQLRDMKQQQTAHCLFTKLWNTIVYLTSLLIDIKIKKTTMKVACQTQVLNRQEEKIQDTRGEKIQDTPDNQSGEETRYI